MKKLLNDPIVRFLAIGIGLYVLWFALYEWWIHPMAWVDKLVIDNTIFSSVWLLEFFGFEMIVGGDRQIGIVGTPGLFIGDSCNGISLFALYSIFILAFPGKTLSKLVFIPLGILIIHVLNTVRVVLLAIIETYSYTWTEFNHTYTFTLLIYAVIFALWYYWVIRYSSIKPKK